jgi:hypothetical protein
MDFSRSSYGGVAELEEGYTPTIDLYDDYSDVDAMEEAVTPGTLNVNTDRSDHQMDKTRGGEAAAQDDKPSYVFLDSPTDPIARVRLLSKE